MAGRALALVWLSGCSFTHGAASVPFDAGSDSAKSQPDAATLPDAAVDATAPTGSIAVTPETLTTGDVKLAIEGTTDWAHWGYGGVRFDHKAGGTAISDATGSGQVFAIVGSAVTSSWTGGAPDLSATATNTGIASTAPDHLSLTVAAGTASQTLRLYVSGHSARGKLVLALSDSSAASYTNNQFQSGGDWYGRYTIVFHAAAAGQTLSVDWYDDADFTGNAWTTLLSATLY